MCQLFSGSFRLAAPSNSGHGHAKPVRQNLRRKGNCKLLQCRNIRKENTPVPSLSKEQTQPTKKIEIMPEMYTFRSAPPSPPPPTKTTFRHYIRMPSARALTPMLLHSHARTHARPKPKSVRASFRTHYTSATAAAAAAVPVPSRSHSNAGANSPGGNNHISMYER